MSITIVTLLKRREGMSKDDFIAYYESSHRIIGEKVLAGYGTRYVRRFLHPLDGQDQDYDLDVLTEIEFPDQATCDAFFASLDDPATRQEITLDEEKLFDRTRIRAFAVEERESTLP